jgi:DASS family divalent anion:Na+ symporter
MLHPLPGAAVVIIGLAATVANGTPMREVLGGYAEPSVWLVFAAMVMARVLLETGAAQRIALLFVRQFGQRSIGISYALSMSDITLAAGVPSITARSGSMVMAGGQGHRRALRLRGPGRRRGASAPRCSLRCTRAPPCPARCS